MSLGKEGLQGHKINAKVYKKKKKGDEHSCAPFFQAPASLQNLPAYVHSPHLSGACFGIPSRIYSCCLREDQVSTSLLSQY